jgi:uncharacterized membrane protein SpoIIM required for sporulation
MTQRSFVQRRSPDWQELETLLTRAARRGIRSLDPTQVERLGSLYRAMGSDLAYAQGRYDARLTDYLNRSIARAHAYVYAPTAQSGWSRIARFYAIDFPSEVRRSILPIALCTALTVAAAVMAYTVTRTHPEDVYAFLPAQLVPAHITKSLHDSNFAFGTAQAPMMSAFIITNNVRIAMTAFAGAATLGALTVYIIAFNGLMLGALGAAFTNAGFGTDFWVTIAPHGVIELTAIQIAGAAGLLIAGGVLTPGRLRRKDAIVLAARRAAVLFLGVASMLLVAGTIEGFISPQRWPVDLRGAIGAVTAVLLASYFGLAGWQATSGSEAEGSAFAQSIPRCLMRKY